MPLPEADMEARIKQAAEWLLGFGKSEYMFLVPELALIQEMEKQSGSSVQAIVSLSSDLDDEAKGRLRNNLPCRERVSILEEPHFPRSFFPKNGMLVISGYMGGGQGNGAAGYLSVGGALQRFSWKKSVHSVCRAGICGQV